MRAQATEPVGVVAGGIPALDALVDRRASAAEATDSALSAFGWESTMTTTDRTETDERDLGRFWILIALACAGTVVAAAAGLVLGIADPDDGSTGDGLFRTIAAVGGLSAGALFGAAAIWAQVKNLWRFAPRWFRYIAWGVLAIVAIAGILSSAARSG